MRSQHCCCYSIAVMSNPVTPWTVACQASLSFTLSWSLLRFVSIESVMLSNHLILCHPFLPSIFPSIRFFSNELSVCIRWPKYWNSASASVLTINILGWFPLRLSSLITKKVSKVLSSTKTAKHQFFCTQPSLRSNSHICAWLLEKP